MLDLEGRVTVAQLGKTFAISTVTARADLDALAGAGMVVRSHGGAVKPMTPVQDYPLHVREQLHAAEKARIGQAAAELVQPEHTIILDAGTTTIEIARHLRRGRKRPLTVITNAVNVALELAAVPGVPVVVLGGLLRPASLSLAGPQAERNLRDLNADHLFLAVDGFQPESGPSAADILEAQLKAVMIAAAREVTVVADSSKFGRRSLLVVARTEAIRRVITDSALSAEDAVALRSVGVEVITV